MDGYIAGPFEVVLGTHQFSGEIYVAPIEEEMLLGLDFLERLLFSIALTPGVYLIFLLYISNPWRNTNQNQCQISESTWNLVLSRISCSKPNEYIFCVIQSRIPISIQNTNSRE
jgi:hypothetical protein